VALSLTGTVRDPFFSTRPDGVQAISFQLECGKNFRVRSVDGEDRREMVYPLDGGSLAPGAGAAAVRADLDRLQELVPLAAPRPVPRRGFPHTDSRRDIRCPGCDRDAHPDA
jgi:hypothetical protein